MATEKYIETLRCTICSQYLSYFPISITARGKNICGRCNLPPGSHTRNYIYETAVENLLFPCRHIVNGCCEKLAPRNIPQHEEKLCLHRNIVDCITQSFTNCVAIVTRYNMLKHCHEAHPQNLLKDSEFVFDAGHDSKSTWFLEHEGGLYTWGYDYKVKPKTFAVKLTPRANYQLDFICGDKSASFYCKTQEEQVTLTWLLTSSEQPAKFHPALRVTITFENKDPSKLCKRCHVLCPLQGFTSCTWAGSKETLVAHLFAEHARSFLNDTKTYSIAISPAEEVMYAFVVPYLAHYFRLVYIQRRGKFYWIVNKIGDLPGAFTYEIHFGSISDKVKSTQVQQLCGVQCTKQQLLANLHDYFFLTLDHIKGFFTEQDKVKFRIEMFGKGADK